jgi:hypothetical protein
MNQKIYDIIPPEESPNLVEEKEEKRNLFPKKAFIVFLFFILSLGGLFYFTTEPKAEIVIYPKTKEVNFKTSLNIDSSLNSIMFFENTIPGKIVETEKTVSQEFPSSGKSFKKAEGTIRLFNKFATWPETWAEGTRFVSGDGKLFKSKSKIYVPAVKKEGSKKIASFVDVEVIAAEPGEEYNIKPTHFSIYVYRGTARYSYYWGESSEVMSGGGETLKITEEDLENAEEILSQKALSESKSSLVSEIGENDIVVEELVESEIVEFSPLAKVGQEIKSFMAQTKAKSRAIVFENKDLEKFASLYLSEETENEVFKESISVDYSPSFLSRNGGEKIEDGTIFLNLDISADTYKKIDFDFLERKCFGKSVSEAKSDILTVSPDIKDLEINLWPFWVKKIPLESNKIEISLKSQK